MKLYTFDDVKTELSDLTDPVTVFLTQFDYGYTDDIYPLYENTQDKNVKELLEHADFLVVTKDILYKRHILNLGGFKWPPYETDDWFMACHDGKERWGYMKAALLSLDKLRIPPLLTMQVKYKGQKPLSIRWQDGFYIAERDGEIIQYDEMTKQEYDEHIAILKKRGQIL